MLYLLDVNALVALGLIDHEFHQRVASWIRSNSSATFSLATCSISELGFVRVLSQASAYGLTVAQARDLLARLKRSRTPRLTFIADAHDILQLPSWVRTVGQITDGHLFNLAKGNSGLLATLDENIPDSYLIPK